MKGALIGLCLLAHASAIKIKTSESAESVVSKSFQTVYGAFNKTFPHECRQRDIERAVPSKLGPLANPSDAALIAAEITSEFCCSGPMLALSAYNSSDTNCSMLARTSSCSMVSIS